MTPISIRIGQVGGDSCLVLPCPVGRHATAAEDGGGPEESTLLCPGPEESALRIAAAVEDVWGGLWLK